MNTKDAIQLAHHLKYGPFPCHTDLMPDTDEAITLIREERRTCGFNWLTGAEAERILQNEKTK